MVTSSLASLSGQGVQHNSPKMAPSLEQLWTLGGWRTISGMKPYINEDAIDPNKLLCSMLEQSGEDDDGNCKRYARPAEAGLNFQ